MSENIPNYPISNLDESYYENCIMEFRKKWYLKNNEPVLCSIESFELIKTLGTGSFGRVMLVKKKKSSEYLAMKILSKQRIYKTKQIAHTISEKKILTSITHPFIVNLLYSFKDNFNLYMVLEFVNGGEMFSHLRNSIKYEEKQARFYASQVILAFEYLHYMKVVYRDLKPENILIDKFGYIKITDFGFAKRMESRTYTLCGTPEYLAPEILLNKGYSLAIDWWALGILIYEMTAGYPPFYDSEPLKTYEKILKGEFKIQKHFSESLLSLIVGLLEKDLTHRLGNLKSGPKEIKNHKWFQSFDWLGIINKNIPAPFIPTISNSCDTSNFDNYDEEEIGSCEFPLYESEFEQF